MATDTNTPLVSALCVVYNQAPYLRQCLDGLVMQETTFPYEIIIHDDASTDGSQDIIREYAERYPDRIRTILQKENQFSQKKEIWATFLIPEARGKYITFCEGDDWWCDPHKLQRQADFMEQNPDVSICYHQFREYDQLKQDYEPHDNPAPKDGLSVKELFWGGYMHTSTFMIRVNAEAEQLRRDIGWVKCMDIVTVYLYMDRGRIAGLPGYMSVWRKNTGIWSTSTWYRNLIENLIMNASIRSVVKDQRLRDELDKWNDEFRFVLFRTMHEWDGNRNSKAYKLGKTILMPFNKIKNILSPKRAK